MWPASSLHSVWLPALAGRNVDVEIPGAKAGTPRLPRRHRRALARRPDAADAGDRRDRRGDRRGRADLGGGAPREGQRGDDVRAVPADAASSLSGLDDHRRRPGDRLGERRRGAARRHLSGRDAERRDRDGRGAPDGEVRRGVSGIPRGPRRRASRAGSARRGRCKNREYRAVVGLLAVLALLSFKAL